ncbi:MAG: PAS domain-containing protein [Lachnospira sp.]|nr:PAS domain-containing protein [Lachnospira sp.]MDD5828389.1 PAS domain-containing protein [Lachnospira sp.]
MAKSTMISVPFTQFSMEMRSGKIIEIDEGFTSLLGYTEEDVKAGLVFKQFVPDVEYDEIITVLREKFIEHRYTCYRHEFLTKEGKSMPVVSFYKIQNKLLDGHRVLKVSVADIAGIEKE